MKINSVKIKNFYSIQNIEINFDKYSGLVILKGKNLDTGGSNGAGKSAVFEAVVWGLFGKTIRKSNEDALVNNVAKKHCEVTLTLNDDITVTRGRKPSHLDFEVNGESKTQATIADTQKLVEDVLNTNYKVFMASTLFGQHNNLDFLGASPEDKRTIIKNFLNLNDLFKRRDRIRGHKSVYSNNIKVKTAVIDEHIKAKKDIEARIKKIHLDKANYDYEEVDISLEEILSREGEVRDLTAMSREISGHRRSLRRDLSECRKLLKEGKTTCPVCKGSSSVDKSQLKKRENSSQQEIDKISKKLVNLEKKLNKIDIPLSSCEYSKYLEYKELCSKEGTYEELLCDLDSKIVDADTTKLENVKGYEVMRFWEVAFSEHGMIKYIIRNILDYFNSKCNTYLSYLTGGQMLIHFNEELDEVLTIGGKITQYISLSGGERRKVNLAVMLSLQSLLSLTEKEQGNLIFFDEVAENLDQDGLKGLYILLQELKKEKTVFLITHNKNFKSLLDNAKRLTIIKDQGISTLLKG